MTRRMVSAEAAYRSPRVRGRDRLLRGAIRAIRRDDHDETKPRETVK